MITLLGIRTGKQGVAFVFDQPVRHQNRPKGTIQSKEWWVSWQSLAAKELGMDPNDIECAPVPESPAL